jgi:hypothetical protein
MTMEIFRRRGHYVEKYPFMNSKISIGRHIFMEIFHVELFNHFNGRFSMYSF